MDYLREFEKNLSFYISDVLDVPLGRPHWIYVSLTHKCNLDCRMCVVKNLLTDFELEIEIVKKAFDEISGWGSDSVVVLTGGEPFLRKDIFDIIGYASKKGLAIEAVSNGSIIDERLAEVIVLSGLRNIAISLDGATEAIHDTIRNRPGSFSSALDAIKFLRRAKDRCGSRIQISAWSTIMKHNLAQLSSIIPLAKEAGVECLVYHPVIVQQADMRKTKKEGSCWIYNEESEKLKEELERIDAYRREHGVVAFLHEPSLFVKYFDNSLTKDDWKCNPFVFINIGPNGVVSCCGEPSFGDLHFQTLDECLNSEYAKEARSRMKKCLKPCLQTCWARPESDCLETIVLRFLDDLSRDRKSSKEEKKRFLKQAMGRLSDYKAILEKGRA